MTDQKSPATKLPTTMFINGERTPSAAGKTFPIYNPPGAECRPPPESACY
jgi:phenylacetaldehyde dehydrogenase